MEYIVEKKKQRKKKVSVFDAHVTQIKGYLNIGISLASIHKLICNEHNISSPNTTFYSWTIKNGICKKTMN